MKINHQALPARHEEPLTPDDSRARLAFCRCWKSKKFPYCDGSHREHNREFNDDVGPIIVVREA